MSRKSLKSKAADYIWQAGLSTVFWGSVTIASNRYFGTHIDWVAPLIVGPVTPILHNVLDLWKPAAPSISVAIANPGRRGMFASDTRWSVGGFGQQERRDGYTSRKIRYDAPKPELFEWTVRLKNYTEPVKVDEDHLFRMIQAASRRQYSGEPHPLSRLYFTRKYRPPFRTYEYEATITVLDTCGLIRNRRGGTSGVLRYPQQVNFAVAYAKEFYTRYI